MAENDASDILATALKEMDDIIKSKIKFSHNLRKAPITLLRQFKLKYY